MTPLVECAIPVRFLARDIGSKRDAFLVMFRFVIGNAMAAGHRLEGVADDLGISIGKLADWIAGAVGDHEVETMTRKCIAFAHGIGMDPEAVEA